MLHQSGIMSLKGLGPKQPTARDLLLKASKQHSSGKSHFEKLSAVSMINYWPRNYRDKTKRAIELEEAKQETVVIDKLGE